jgi:hypothetical protein
MFPGSAIISSSASVAHLRVETRRVKEERMHRRGMIFDAATRVATIRGRPQEEQADSLTQAVLFKLGTQYRRLLGSPTESPTLLRG